MYFTGNVLYLYYAYPLPFVNLILFLAVISPFEMSRYPPQGIGGQVFSFSTAIPLRRWNIDLGLGDRQSRPTLLGGGLRLGELLCYECIYFE